MLIVKDMQGNIEALTNIQNCEINEEVNGDFSISFASFLSESNAHSYPLLQDESLLELDGHEFRVKNLVEVRNKKQVTALHIFFDLIEHQVYGYMGGTKSADDIFNFILDGSGWTFENIDVSNHVVLSNFGEGNVIKLIRDACNALDCEIRIMPGKHLKLYQRIGDDTDSQFRYRHNIKTLKKSVDTSNLRTIIKGFGADGLEVTYRSPMADIYGERHAEPIKDDRYSVVDSMLDRLKQELNDKPDISIEIEVVQLDFDANLGDQLWTIYEPLGMDIKSRISARKRFPFSKRSPTVTIENRKKTFTDILTQQRVEIDQNKKETRSRFDQTNERITMEVERVDESIATLSLEADDIKLSVEAVEQSVAAVNIRADNIVLSVQSLDGRVGSAEASISIQAGMISSKVGYDGVISAINQSPEAITLDASKINLLGITTVANRLNIGDVWNASEQKGLYFRGTGSTAILSNRPDELKISVPIGTLEFEALSINFLNNPSVYGLTASNAQNANTVGYYYPHQFAKNLYGHQDISLEVTGSGGLRVHVNGKVATFAPTSWT